MNIEEEIKNSEQLSQWLDKKIDGLEIKNNDDDDNRYWLAGGCLDIAREHHQSIVLLLDNKFYGSAATLLRSICESCVRGIWLFCYASEYELNQFKEDKLNKPFCELIEIIEKLEPFNVGILSDALFKNKLWKVMNSYTHCGWLHVLRRIKKKEGEISPNYTDGEILQVIAITNVFAILTGLAIINMTDNEKLVKEVSEKAREYFKVK